MIISMTPLRVSFLGGGTDYPEHFDHHGGATLGGTIDKYIYITVSPLTEFFDHRIRVSYSRTELVKSIEEIIHPSVRHCLNFLEIERGVEINIVSDLPARTGLGSSSSFTVGLLHALHAFKGQLVDREQLAAEAVYIERELIKERVGLQDQYTCACGGMLSLEFRHKNRVTVSPVIMPHERLKALQDRLMIFYTGLQRYADQVLKQQMERTQAGTLLPYLSKMRDLVQPGIEILANGYDLSNFGSLLHESWTLKRELSDSITNPEIDEAYENARKAGAVGGKLLGAGGGGFLLLYVEPYNQESVRKVMNGMREVKFNFENQGSHLIFYRP